MVGLDEPQIADLVNYVCRVGQRQRVYYLWRPFLKDPKDDLVLELGITASCEGIVTLNVKDFAGADQFGCGS